MNKKMKCKSKRHFPKGKIVITRNNLIASRSITYGGVTLLEKSGGERVKFILKRHKCPVCKFIGIHAIKTNKKLNIDYYGTNKKRNTRRSAETN